jgi:hypothetical protein
MAQRGRTLSAGRALRWFQQLDPKDFDLASGNRVLVGGGKLEVRYQVTVPEDLDGVS